MSRVLQLPPELLQTLLKSPKQCLQFEQGIYQVEVRILDTLSEDEDDIPPQEFLHTQQPGSDLFLEPLGLEHLGLENLESTDPPQSSPDAKEPSALSTNHELRKIKSGAISPDLFLDATDKPASPKKSDNAVDPGLFFEQTPTRPPKRKSTNKPTSHHGTSPSLDRIPAAPIKAKAEGMKLQLLDESSTQTPQQRRSRDDIVSIPNKTSEPSFDNAFEHPEFDYPPPTTQTGSSAAYHAASSSQHNPIPQHNAPTPPTRTNTSSHRLLRTTDTPIALHMLFKRLSLPIDQSIHLKHLPTTGDLTPLELAQRAAVKFLLSRPIPICEDPNDPPSYRLIGQLHNGDFVLFYQDQQGILSFAPIYEDGGTLQIALKEGEQLLTEAELTQIFQLGARFVGPEVAKQKALQLQHQLQPDEAPAKKENQFTLRPANTRNNAKIRKIKVTTHLIQRLNHNRIQDDNTAWDESLQPGIAVFRNNLATLYQNEKPLLEGVLICVISQGSFMIFDRRSKKRASLEPNANQTIWIRRIDSH